MLDRIGFENISVDETDSTMTLDILVPDEEGEDGLQSSENSSEPGSTIWIREFCNYLYYWIFYLLIKFYIRAQKSRKENSLYIFQHFLRIAALRVYLQG